MKERLWLWVWLVLCLCISNEFAGIINRVHSSFHLFTEGENKLAREKFYPR